MKETMICGLDLIENVVHDRVYNGLYLKNSSVKFRQCRIRARFHFYYGRQNSCSTSCRWSNV